MKLSITRPLSTATPDKAMKPTAAETENGMPRSHSAATPPVSASGTALKTSRASRAEPSALNKQQKNQGEAGRYDDHQPFARRRRDSRTARPRPSNNLAETAPARSILACASATTEPMSRPRTLAVTTTRRLPFSRLIWLGPSERRKVATCRSGNGGGALSRSSEETTGRFLSSSRCLRASGRKAAR